MNHIRRLQEKKSALEQELEGMKARLQELRQHLLLPKFTESASGERVDWICTADVIRWCYYIENGGAHA